MKVVAKAKRTGRLRSFFEPARVTFIKESGMAATVKNDVPVAIQR